MPDVSYRFLAESVSYHFGIDADRLRPDSTFEELEMDSLALMELVVVIENETGIRIPDDVAGIGPNATLSEIADAVKRISECAAPSAEPVPCGDQVVPHVDGAIQFGGSRVE